MKRKFIVERPLWPHDVLKTTNGDSFKVSQEINESDLSSDEIENYLNLEIISVKGPRYFKVACLTIGGKWNRIYNSKDVISESVLDTETIEYYLEDGGLIEVPEPTALKNLEKQLKSK